MFDHFFSLFSHDIGIDLGTANTFVFVKGKGIVAREPSVIALHKKTKKVVAFGTEAKKMVGKTPANIITIKPLKGGIISDFDATVVLLSYLLSDVHKVGTPVPFSFARPKVVVAIPSSVTEEERGAVWEAALTAGARKAFLIEEPMAAAIGEGISIFKPTGSMVVDIGGGTTEIAVISLGGIVVSRSLRLGGDNMDQALGHYIRLRHGILLGDATIENLKIKIGSAYKKSSKLKFKSEKLTEKAKESEENVKIEVEGREKMAIVRGRDIETGLPKSLRITEIEVREALSPVITRIIEQVAGVLEESPPELTNDILEHGILLTGGGSLLPGFDHLVVERTRMPVVHASDPLTTVAKGTGKVLEDQDLLNRVKVIGGLQ